jgi:hypothetical protein
MRQQVFLNSRFANDSLPDGSLLFTLNPHIQTPGPEYQLTLSLLDVSIPLTNYVVHAGNNVLNIEIIDQVLEWTITFLPGNYSIDGIITQINDVLTPNKYTASYDENTNKVTIATEEFKTLTFSIAGDTTCQRLLGFAVGDSSVNGVLVGGGGVDLTGSQAFYVRGNLKTRNRDPQTRSYGNFLGKVTVTRSFNGLEKWTNSSGYRFAIQDTQVSFITIQIIDDDLKPVTLNGGSWDMTLEFDVVLRERYFGAVDYRTPLDDGQIADGADSAAGKRPDAGGQPA